MDDYFADDHWEGTPWSDDSLDPTDAQWLDWNEANEYMGELDDIDEDEIEYPEWLEEPLYRWEY